MSGTLTSPAAQVNDLGIFAPAYDEVLTYLQDSLKAIYGDDLYLEPDSQDGQMIAIFAKAAHDLNSLAVAVYNSFSPATAQGAGLSRLVKINGITRAISTNSTADLLVSGNVGAVITNGIAVDPSGNLWALPSPVVIPPTGSILVTAICTEAGSITAQAGAITGIQTPTAGWISVTNPQQATTGAPVETDAALRARQSISASLPAQSTIDGMYAALDALPGVQRVGYFENNTDTTDTFSNTPPHSINFVVEGGDTNQIAQTIFLKKSQGVNTFSSSNTNVVVLDANGVPHTISFTRPTQVFLNVAITLKALPGYTTVIGDAIKAAIVAGAQDAISGMNAPGQAVYVTRLYKYATLPVDQGGNTYDIYSISVSYPGIGNDAYGNLFLPISSVPMWTTINIAITVV